MDLADLDATLGRLEQAVARAGANLVELEQDPTVAMLDMADLAGVTAVRWADATAARRALFDAHRAVAEVVARAGEWRRRRPSLGADRAARIAALLAGPSVALGGRAVAPAERALLAGSRRLDHSPPDVVLERMAAWYATVGEVVTTVARTWDQEVPRVAALRRLAADVGALAADLDEPSDLATKASTQLDHLAEVLLADPMAHDPAALAAVEDSLRNLASDLDEIRRVREDWAAQLDAARTLLDDVAHAQAATAAARQAVAARIAAVPAVVTEPAERGLADALDQLSRLSATTSWRANARQLAVWRAHATAALDAAVRTTNELRGLLNMRDELRGRLDAYHAKAAHLGALEDERLSALHTAARDELMTAPTDLARAAACVSAYQSALAARGAPVSEEAS